MANSAPALSLKDSRRRDMILNGNLWWVVFSIGAPMALFQSLNQIFKILDSLMAAHISPLSVSTVAYLSQINLALSSIGLGLATGASIKISEAYGSADNDLVHRRVSSLLMISFSAAACILLLIPFTGVFLRVTGTPAAFVQEGSRYFAVSLLDIALLFINNAYIAIERARGNSARILWLNLTTIIVKLSLTALFVYGLQGDVTMIAVATVASNLVVFTACVWNLGIRGKGSVFGFSLRAVCWNKTVTQPMLVLSIPVMAEKVLFQVGKVLINGMATAYGDLTTGALGISNNLGGMTTSPQNGFQDAGAAIISQNRGAGRSDRVLGAFYRIVAVNCCIGALGWWITWALEKPIGRLFAPENPAFADLIMQVYSYERCALVFLGLFSAVMSLLYGIGLTKITLVINFSRVFVFRLPVLWALQNFTQLGSESVGIAMMVSNISTGVMAVLFGIYAVLFLKKEQKKKRSEYPC